jgi:hypothetical protein
MAVVGSHRDVAEHEAASTPPVPQGQAAETPPPWELVANGRYMPRRIRGSFPGRELG